MHHDVVGRVQPLALEFVGDHGDGPGWLVAHHAAAAVLAGELPALEVERVAVAVAGRVAEHGDAAVLLDPAHLDVVGDVAPHQVAADAVPRGTLGPQRAGVEPLDGRVATHVPAEAIVEGDDVGVGILERRLRRSSRAASGPAIPEGRWRAPGLPPGALDTIASPPSEVARKARRFHSKTRCLRFAGSAMADMLTPALTPGWCYLTVCSPCGSGR